MGAGRPPNKSLGLPLLKIDSTVMSILVPPNTAGVVSVEHRHSTLTTSAVVGRSRQPHTRLQMPSKTNTVRVRLLANLPTMAKV